MRIIGKTDDGFILQATCDEVANFAGYYYAYSGEAKAHHFKPDVGVEIAIGEMYQQLYSLAGAIAKVRCAQSNLRAVADLLEPVCPLIQEAISVDHEPTND